MLPSLSLGSGRLLLHSLCLLLSLASTSSTALVTNTRPKARRREQPIQQQQPPPPPRKRSQRNHEPPDPSYFASVAAAGAISCSVTHAMVVPIDVVKTRLQMDASLRGPVDAIKSVIAGGHGKGAARLLPFFNGVGATAVGYLAQGAFKFGGYEFFKRSTFAALREQGETGEAIAHHMRLPIMIGSAAAAEVVASAALCPLEVLKLKMQTSPQLAALGLRGAMVHVLKEGGLTALFKGFAPIAMRQVPYTACKLVSFEMGYGSLQAAVCRRLSLRRERLPLHHQRAPSRGARADRRAGRRRGRRGRLSGQIASATAGSDRLGDGRF